MADISRIKAIKIGLASPEDILNWSFGEVKKPETINYRTFKPERDGLFCERIFGPTRDWECTCGRYKRVKNKGIRCERCGVEVTRARVRRERMGHIELASPVCHVWYLKGQPPSPLALLLDLPAKQIEKVVYFTNYIVIDIDRTSIEQNLGDLQRFLEEEKQNFELEIERKFQELDARLELELERLKDELTEQQIAERVRLNENRKEGERRELAGRLAEMEKAIETLAKLQQYQLIDEATWQGVETLLLAASRRFQRDLRPLVRVGQGASAIEELLKNIDLEKLSRELKEEFNKTAGQRRARVIKRLEMVEAFRNSKTRPEWMILKVVPVLPPELRPMVQLDGGRFATSDLNDLYRRIVNRNNRLRRILEIRAPKTIANSERRLLQEAVDSLIDNSRRSKPVVGTGGRPLKSLSDMLKGKEGRFRKNLLGKRVDYSGRSVIVVGPHLKLHQCGLPKEMALELFKPFVMHRLIHGPEQIASNVKNAKAAIDRQIPEVWKALETVIKEHPVLLNRAPTLHRLGIQAFEPILVEGKAIQLHPLVCHAYNADFDGDQMAVHVPLSYQAQAEARTLMLSVHNLFKPADGSPVVSPLQDIVLGAYYLTMNDPRGETELVDTFANPETALHALEHRLIRLHLPIRVYLTPAGEARPQLVTTTAGHLIFHSILPEELRYHPDWLNTVFTKKQLSAIIREVYNACGHMRTVAFLDDLKALGFEWAMRGGITFAVTDLKTPSKREEILKKAEAEAQKLDMLYNQGELTLQEKRQRLTELWQRTYEEVAKAMLEDIEPDNPLFIITDSGARGSYKQLAQLVGMRGLMMGGFDIHFGGERLIEELPIIGNFQTGLTSQEYFVSGYGARRGLSSTALLTSSAGYLTRRMCDVAQDVVVRMRDCGIPKDIGIVVARIVIEGELIEPLFQRIRGRTARRTLRHPYTGELLAEENTIISEATAQTIDTLAEQAENFLHMIRELRNKEEGELFMPEDDRPLVDPRTGEVLLEPFKRIDHETLDRLRARVQRLKELWKDAGFEWVEHERVGVPIRSPLTCFARQGICARCYGLDWGTLKPVELGTAVGIIAAESIGEPGTQLTMRVFHTGGVAGAGQQIATSRTAEGGGMQIVIAGFLSELEERGVLEEEGERKLVVDAREVLLQVARKRLNRDTFDNFLKTYHIPQKELIQFTSAHFKKSSVDAILQNATQFRTTYNPYLLGTLWDKLIGLLPPDRISVLVQKMGKKIWSAEDALQKAEPIAKVLMQYFGENQYHGYLHRFIWGTTPDEETVKQTVAHLIIHYQFSDEEISDGDKNIIRTLYETLLPIVLANRPDEDQRREKQFKEALRKIIKLSEPRATGINRVEDLFEARKPKGEAIIADYEGEVVDILRTGIQRWVVIEAELPVGEQLIGKLSLEDIPEPDTEASPDQTGAEASKPETTSPSQKEGFLLRAMEEIRPSHVARLSEAGVKTVRVLDAILVPTFGELEVQKGDKVLPGDRITPGPLNPHDLLRLRGVRKTQEYLIQEIQAVYKAQGVDIDDKHIEVIIRQMFRKRRVVDPGDTYFLPGQTVDRFVFEETNAKVRDEGGKPATADWVLQGVSESAHQTESFLSSASFQRTQKMLTEAAVRGKVDELVGLKENVIIGRLIPAGTGFVKPQFIPRFERVSAPEPKPIAVKPVESEPTLGTLFQEELQESTDGGAPPSGEGGRVESSSEPKRARKKKQE